MQRSKGGGNDDDIYLYFAGFSGGLCHCGQPFQETFEHHIDFHVLQPDPYHGKDGFSTFSHRKSIVDKKTWLDLPMRYQPYREIYDKIVHFFLSL